MLYTSTTVTQHKLLALPKEQRGAFPKLPMRQTVCDMSCQLLSLDTWDPVFFAPRSTYGIDSGVFPTKCSAFATKVFTELGNMKLFESVEFLELFKLS